MSSNIRWSLCFLGLISVLCCCSEISKSQVRIVYTYPIRNAIQVSAKTTIGIRFAEAISKSLLSNSAFAVTGTLSGVHTGKVSLSTDLRTVIFTPDKFFSAGEKVGVSVSPLVCKSGKNTEIYYLTFQISKSRILPNSLLAAIDWAPGSSPFLTSSAQASSLPADFPPIQITKNSKPSPGHYYLSNFTYVQSIFGMYLMTLDNSGNVLYQRSTYPIGAQDFRLQPNGLFTYFDLRAKKFYALDSNFAVVDSFAAVNGYETDYHDLCILPNNNGYALLAIFYEKVDLSKVAGDTDATVINYALQKFDQDKNLVFEWRTNDSGHFLITDEIDSDLSLHTIDYVHCNSIDFDPRDSTFILSSRSLDEITKINPEDGTMIWRLGGKHNQFAILNDPVPFSHQHDVRRLPNGNLTLFDNGNLHNSLSLYSRAVEYILDEKAKYILKVWEFRHNPDVISPAMGSVQQLSNGNKLIGWGICDSVAATEVQPDGTTVWEMRLPIGLYNYRMYKAVNDPLAAVGGSHDRLPVVTLEQNYPNPFSGSTTINFRTSSHTPISLIVYDALGREVRILFDGIVEPGEYSAKLEAGDLPSGLYLCKLTTPASTLSREVILSK
jgi:hypothetical protein